MPLAEILAPINAALTGVETLVGSEYLMAHGALPRIVWIPTNDRFERGQGRRGTGIGPRSVGTRVVGVRAHIWGADFTATERLVDRVVWLLHQAAFGDYIVEDGEWMAAEGGEAWSQLGKVYVLSVRINTPIVPATDDDPNTTAQFNVITTAEVEGTADFPSTDVVATPAP